MREVSGGGKGAVPSEGKRHVDTVESHPINFLLPSVPIPERAGITDGADVHVVTVLDGELGMGRGGRSIRCFSRSPRWEEEHREHECCCRNQVRPK